MCVRIVIGRLELTPVTSAILFCKSLVSSSNFEFKIYEEAVSARSELLNFLLSVLLQFERLPRTALRYHCSDFAEAAGYEVALAPSASGRVRFIPGSNGGTLCEMAAIPF